MSIFEPPVKTVFDESSIFASFGIDITQNEIDNSLVTVVAYGAGQDSQTILSMLGEEAWFREKYAKHRVIVLFADTGNEHPFTYDYIQRVTIPYCKKHGFEFVHIKPEMGFHSEGWTSLTHQWKRNRPTIGSMAYPKSCSHNLKLLPQYNYIGNLIAKENNLSYGNKSEYKTYAKIKGKIRWLIGIAKGEEKRVNGKFYYESDNEIIDGVVRTLKGVEVFSVEYEKKKYHNYAIGYEGSDRFIMINNKKRQIKFEYIVKYKEKWKEQSIITHYPLIDIGYDRTACQKYLNSIDMEIPFPSNCMFCPFSSGSHKEILWIYLNMPKRFYEWVSLEDAKLQFFKNNHNFILNKIEKVKDENKIKIEVDTLSKETITYLNEQLSYAKANDKQITINCINYIEVDVIEDFVKNNDEVQKVKIKNLGACARTHKLGDKKGQPVTLLDVLAEAQAKYPDITLEELNHHKFSHGHCVESTF